MDSSFKWKFGFIAGTTLLGVYALVPTLAGWPAKRAELEAHQKPVPWHYNAFPKKGLNLGLDLQGGIYTELDVELKEAVGSRMNLVAQELFRDLKRKDLDPAEWHFDSEQFAVVASIPQPKREKFLDQVLKFRQLVGGDFVYIFIEKPGASDPSQIVLGPTEDFERNIRQDIMQQATQAVRNRIDRYGLAEPSVQRQGESRIVVELPGVKDPDRALKIVQQAGTLEFKMVNDKTQAPQLTGWIDEARKANSLAIGYSFEDVRQLNELLKNKISAGTEVAFELKRQPNTNEILAATPYLLDSKAFITGEMLANAKVNFDNNEPFVSLDFNPEGAKNFADLTKAHVKERLAILLDGFVHSAPVIQEPILGGQARITLGYGDRTTLLKEAQDLTLVLQEGALPARLKEATKTVIGPTLGLDSIRTSFKAMMIAAVLVIFFMLIYYKWSGLLANAAVVINTLFIFALLAMFQATLTLPGMAGIILTIGMAVDANVLIFERMREELSSGQQPRHAVELAYSNALRAIIDSNLTTVIAGVILYQFGTGPIKGFAVTLIIGLVCNIITAVTMTRTVFDYCVVERKTERISI